MHYTHTHTRTLLLPDKFPFMAFDCNLLLSVVAVIVVVVVVFVVAPYHHMRYC